MVSVRGAVDSDDDKPGDTCQKTAYEVDGRLDPVYRYTRKPRRRLVVF